MTGENIGFNCPGCGLKVAYLLDLDNLPHMFRVPPLEVSITSPDGTEFSRWEEHGCSDGMALNLDPPTCENCGARVAILFLREDAFFALDLGHNAFAQDPLLASHCWIPHVCKRSPE